MGLLEITPSTRRTLKHGDLSIVAIRPGQVQVGNTTYSSDDARRVAQELPNDQAHQGMAAKLFEQADWADGRDL